MAKAKKTASAPSAKKKAPAKKKAEQQPAGGAAPMIDTNLAAQTAAAMVANRSRQEQEAGQEKPKESGMIQQLKQGLNKPAGGLGGILGGGSAQKRSHLPQGGGRQSGHKHTTGGFNRTGVPRRTAG